MAKFKIGDKVRIISRDKNNSSGLFPGWNRVTGDGCVGRVGYIFWVERNRYSVHPDNEIQSTNSCYNNYYGVFEEYNLELVEEDKKIPKFKVGDRVIIGKDAIHAGSYVGKEVTIKAPQDDMQSRRWWILEADDNKDLRLAVYEDNLTLVYVEDIKINKVEKIMNSVSMFVKNLGLSADDKILRKYNLQDERGEPTEEYKQLILNKFYKSTENKAYAVEIANGLDKEAKENK